MIDRIKNLHYQDINFTGFKKALAAVCFLAAAGCIFASLPSVNTEIVQIMESVKSIEKLGTSWKAVLYSYSITTLAISIIVLCSIFFRKLSHKTICFLISVLIALLLLFITAIVYKYSVHWLHSDLSSEMVLGKLLAEENTLMTTKWYYSTELRVVYQHFFMMPLFKLFDDWHLVRALTVLLNNILLITSYIFMMKQAKIASPWICLTAAFLLLPTNTEYWEIVTFGGYYVFFLAMFFALLGLFFMLVNRTSEKTNGAQKTLFVLFCVLSFVLGITGIRSLMDIQIPLLLTCIFCYLLKYSKSQYPAFLSGLSFLLSGIGYIVNNILYFIFSFTSDLDTIWDNPANTLFQKIGRIIWMFVEYCGFEPNSPLFTFNGILSLFSILFIAGFIILICKLLSGHRHSLELLYYPQTLFLMFFLASALYHGFLYGIINSKYLSFRYFIPIYIFYIPCLAVIFEKINTIVSRRKSFLFILFATIVVFGHGSLKYQKILMTDITSTRSGYIKYLEDNNLTFGFSTFWNANVNAELTNGAIETAGLDITEEGFEYGDWLLPVKFKEPSYRTGNVFLLLSQTEWNGLKNSEPFTQKKPVYEDPYFVIMLYPSAGSFHEELLYRE